MTTILSWLLAQSLGIFVLLWVPSYLLNSVDVDGLRLVRRYAERSLLFFLLAYLLLSYVSVSIWAIEGLHYVPRSVPVATMVAGDVAYTHASVARHIGNIALLLSGILSWSIACTWQGAAAFRVAWLVGYYLREREGTKVSAPMMHGRLYFAVSVLFFVTGCLVTLHVTRLVF